MKRIFEENVYHSACFLQRPFGAADLILEAVGEGEALNYFLLNTTSGELRVRQNLAFQTTDVFFVSIFESY